jgi:DNA-binding LacI/PurR family transcriptional regulator
MSKEINSIADIAKLAGVSKSTVSRALNDSSLLKQETKDKIKAIAEQHNFEAHSAARNLSLQKSNTIGFVTVFNEEKRKVKNFADPFFLEIVGSVSGALYDNGLDLLMAHFTDQNVHRLQQYLSSQKVDGLIILSCLRGEICDFARNLSQNSPIIFLDSYNLKENCSCVSSDNTMGGYLATKHLIETGRKKIAFLGGPQSHAEVKLRLEGYINALTEANIPVENELIYFSDYSGVGGYKTMLEILDKNQKVDSVFINSDIMSFGALNALHERNICVPDEISIVGFDDIPLARYTSPPLTTIRQNIPGIGKKLVQNLMQIMKEGGVIKSTMPVELIIRKSTIKR